MGSAVLPTFGGVISDSAKDCGATEYVIEPRATAVSTGAGSVSDWFPSSCGRLSIRWSSGTGTLSPTGVVVAPVRGSTGTLTVGVSPSGVATVLIDLASVLEA